MTDEYVDVSATERRRTHYTYDQLGRTLSVTRVVDGLDGDPDLGDDVAVRYEYDKLGRVVKTTYPDPDAAGSRRSTVVSTVINDAARTERTTAGDGLLAGQVTEKIYDRLGRLVELREGVALSGLASRTTRYEYDGLSRVVKQTVVGAGAILDAVTEYTYDKNGNLLSVIAPPPEGIAVGDAALRTTTFEYDALNRQVRAIPSPRAGEGQNEVTPDRSTRTIYDRAGRLLGTLDPAGSSSGTTYDVLGRTTAVTDAAGRAVLYKYDDAGRLLETIAPAPQTGGLATVTRYEYDDLDRLTAVTEAYQTLAAQRTEFTYDLVGNRLSLRDAVNNTTTWHYDQLDRADRETNELEDARVYTFDKLGNLVEYTDRNGRVTRYEYDLLGRRHKELWLGDEPLGGGERPVLRTFEYPTNILGEKTVLAQNTSILENKLVLPRIFLLTRSLIVNIGLKLHSSFAQIIIMFILMK